MIAPIQQDLFSLFYIQSYNFHLVLFDNFYLFVENFCFYFLLVPRGLVIACWNIFITAAWKFLSNIFQHLIYLNVGFCWLSFDIHGVIFLFLGRMGEFLFNCILDTFTFLFSKVWVLFECFILAGNHLFGFVMKWLAWLYELWFQLQINF